MAEFAAAVGLPTETGKAYLGEALELRHRLPRTWARVRSGDLAAWRARRIARATIGLSAAAAGFVDDQVARVRAPDPALRGGPAGRGGDRAVHARRGPAPPGGRRGRRHAHVHTDQVSFEGTVWVEAEVDLADALDLDTALSAGAAGWPTSARPPRWTCAAPKPSARWPATSSPSDLDTTDRHRDRRPPTRPAGGAARAPLRARDHRARREAAPGPGGEHPLASSTPTRSAPGAAAPGTTVTVKPVHRPDRAPPRGRSTRSPTGSPPGVQRDLTCVFPWCTRPAEACDNDHVIPYTEGGPTASDNLGPALPAPPPAQDPPLRLGLHRPRTRHLPVVLTPRLPVPARPPRHHRRHPRHAPPDQ